MPLPNQLHVPSTETSDARAEGCKCEAGKPCKCKAGAECACKGVKKMSVKETYDIPGVEIFAAGDWNGDSYTNQDIDDLVEAFNETKSALQPYLKLGHGDEQKLLAADELPSAGWVSRLYRNGDKLIADFTGMPQKIHDLIKIKAYKRVSSEIFIKPKVNGKQYRMALKAVALLGGETPAVQTLDDIHALYTIVGADVRAFEKEAATKCYELEISGGADERASEQAEDAVGTTQEDFNMAAECADKLKDMESKYAAKCEEMEKMTKKHSEVEAKVAVLEKDKADLTAKFSALEAEKTELTAKFTQVSTDLAGEREVRRTAEINGQLDKMIADKKIVPAQRDALFTILKNANTTGEKKFKLGEKEIASEADLVLEFIHAGAAGGLPTTAKTETGANQNAGDLASKAKAYAEKNKVSLKEATIAVSGGKA